ncbi:MAG TPA: DUF2784 domain-containing protein [Thermoanaerobaculia bacterium]|nr:DUF2784 domain-containing protein [Thermoanaerobaculia bacterium]
MPWRMLADLTAIAHLAFVVFVVTGGFLVLRRPWVAWLHVPAAVWGALIEVMNWECPLTGWETDFRIRAGQQGYSGDFLSHWIFGLLYPAGLTRGMQFAIALFVVVLNGGIYALAIARSRRPR